ncbi:MAG: radical SAM protein, partial [Chloroflexi bacterium]|nr:radical SAM protein [Chloroflexota bacterium]
MSITTVRKDDILFSPAMVQQRLDGVCLIIDPSSPNWASTNPIGSSLIRSCDGHRTAGEIGSEFARRHGLQVQDVDRFIDQAIEIGFVSTAPDVVPAYPGRAAAIAPDQLEELWINTNNSCPLRCRHCLVDGGIEPVRPLTAQEIQRLVDEAISLGVKRFYFTGGEPFLRKDLFSLIKYVTDRADLVVLTSGVLLSREKAARLKSIANGRVLMQVSLEGPDAATNDAIRGDGNFDLAVRGIKRLVEAGLPPIVTTTLTRLNYKEAARTTGFLATLGVKDHHILWLHARGRMRQATQALLLEGCSVAETMAGLARTAAERGMIVDNTASIAARVLSKRGRKSDLCNCCYGVLSVNADGHVYPCAALVGAEGFDCGSIKEQGLKQIWLESTVTNWVRQNSVQKRVGCSSCYLKFFCGGGCFAQSYFNYELTQGYGCIMAPDPYCEAYKRLISEIMWQAALPSAEERRETPAIYRSMRNE